MDYSSGSYGHSEGKIRIHSTVPATFVKGHPDEIKFEGRTS